MMIQDLIEDRTRFRCLTVGIALIMYLSDVLCKRQLPGVPSPPRSAPASPSTLLAVAAAHLTLRRLDWRADG